MALNVSFLPNSFGLYILLPSMSIGFFMFFVRSVGLSFLNSSHSVIIKQQSAFLRHSIAEVAYWILFLKIFFAVCMATGS